jgi:hypothetical protein
MIALKLSATGTVRVSGNGIRTIVKRNVQAGTRSFTLQLTRWGRSRALRHEKLKLRVAITAGGRTGTSVITVRA